MQLTLLQSTGISENRVEKMRKNGPNTTKIEVFIAKLRGFRTSPRPVTKAA
jgi:hypothetical protein